MISETYARFAAEKAIELINIDSPSGYTRAAAEWVLNEFRAFGFSASLTRKGGVLVDFGGRENTEDGALLLAAHTDTLGAVVAEIKSDGRLRLSPIGGLSPANTETENVRIHTRNGKVYEGTIQLRNASLHVNREFGNTVRSWDNVEVVIDEPADDAEAVRKLGIAVGDFVCPEPRAHITESGYIKSRYLDDKLSVGILLGFARVLRELSIPLPRRVYAMITVYEEVGHGASAAIPADVTEAISVDMGCVGSGLSCTERQVSICVKDSGGPYDYDVTDRLIKAARRTGAGYATDVYPYYGSDVEAALSAGYDIRHGLIGAGVYASHGYERSHLDGVQAAISVILGYLGLI